MAIGPQKVPGPATGPDRVVAVVAPSVASGLLAMNVNLATVVLASHAGHDTASVA
ncbi:hypothetical protein FHS42_004361 [Streptomyces zagrosensis]|uniref:Uncharacterized protein n=1 Tax=Streptomyces zagrosensis TaxID=1042984 RepID=A0A7W9QE07_9ACTN|nr:hypothetical protein [Streptomyces zagrosensis]